MPWLQLTQMPQRQLAHFAGADDEDGLVAEVVEDLLDVIDGGAGDGHMAMRDAGLGADAAGDLAGVAKQRVQQRADAVVAHGLLVGLLDLAGDLAFADDHAVETGGDAEQVPHSLGLMKHVQVRPDGRDRQPVEVREKLARWPRCPAPATMAGRRVRSRHIARRGCRC